MWRGFAAVICAVLVGYGAVVGVMYVSQDWQVYHPAGRYVTDPGDVGLVYEKVELDGADGSALHGWYLPAESARGTVLFLQGNSLNMSYRMESLRLFNQLGLSVLVFDYRGFGHSEGEPSEQGTYEDALNAWHYLVEQRGVPPQDIVIYGDSLGAAVAAQLATRVSPAGVILQSPFTSAMDVAVAEFPFLPVRTLFRFRYDTLEYAQQIRSPVLVIHREDNPTIPFAHAQRIHEALDGRKRLLALKGPREEVFVRENDAYMRGLDEFVSEL